MTKVFIVMGTISALMALLGIGHLIVGGENTAVGVGALTYSMLPGYTAAIFQATHQIGWTTLPTWGE